MARPRLNDRAKREKKHLPKRDPAKEEEKVELARKRELSPESPNTRLQRKRKEARSTSPFRDPDSSDSDGNTFWDHARKERLKKQSAKEEAESRKREEAERKRKEWPRQDPPIHDVNDIPASWGWHPNDDDVDPRDIEGNIARNRERVEQGILPRVFEVRLKTYEDKKKYIEDLIASEPEGLSMNVIKRLDTLQKTKELLEQKGDENEQLPNIDALMKAYRERKLDWSEESQVTYWNKGEQLCEPRELDFNELLEFNRKHDTGKGFWVEGFSGPGPKLLMASCVIPSLGVPNVWPTHFIWFEVRAPGNTHGVAWKLDFLEDTGANTMTIFDTDLDNLIHHSGRPEPIPVNLGDTMVWTANEPMVSPSVAVEARVAHDGVYSKWFILEAIVKPAPNTRTGNDQYRLSGSWWREALYTATFPDSQRQIYACDNYLEFLSTIPEADPRDVIPISLPRRGDNMAGRFAKANYTVPNNVFKRRGMPFTMM